MCGASHVIILGAGASIAFALHDGERDGKKLPSMNDLTGLDGVKDILDTFPSELVVENFEATYSNISDRFGGDVRLEKLNDIIYSYFAGMYLPDRPTMYDQLIMSLREKDLIATFNWDPFLYQAWWRNYLHGSSPQLLFLHGNVAVGYNVVCDKMGPAGTYPKFDNGFYEPTRLLYPVKKKDYHKDLFIRRQWEILTGYLQSKTSVRVTIFGYSAPVTDVEALKMMKSAWGDIEDRYLEQFEVIDIRDREEVLDSWKGFIHSHHYDYCTSFYESSLAKAPRRTVELFFCRYFPSTPEEAFVTTAPMPEHFGSFDDMWNWFLPMIDQEKKSERLMR